MTRGMLADGVYPIIEIRINKETIAKINTKSEE